MGQGKFVSVQQSIFRIKGVHSFGVIGDPGCEGLGSYNMKVYAGALDETGQDDITLVVGDLVPVGTPHHYQTICDMTEALAKNDVYVLRGTMTQVLIPIILGGKTTHCLRSILLL